jgi:hypothetical protein
MTDLREVSESPLVQGASEKITYTFDWTAIGVPLNPTVELHALTSYKHHPEPGAAIILAGLPTLLGNVVTCPILDMIEANKGYRLSCFVDVGVNHLEAYVDIHGE